MANNLIYSRKVDNSPLDIIGLASRVPSICTEQPMQGLSNRYGSISTLQAIEVMLDHGWHPVQALQKKSRLYERVPYASHLVAFANPSLGDVMGDGRPEVILYNSHDGSSSLKLFAGFYRFICSNGIIAGSGFSGTIRHTANNAIGFESMLTDTIERVPAMLANIERLKSIRVDYWQARTMARLSAGLRWGDLGHESNGNLGSLKSGVYFDNQTLSKILQPVRFEDNFSDAWTVFNRIQESVTRGKTVVASVTRDDDDQVRFKYRNARALGAVSELVRVNRGLWDIVRDTVEV